MTWLWRALPKSFSASSDRTAHAAGTIFEPGKPLRARSASRSAATSPGRNRNRPPNLVRKPRRQVELADVGHIGHDGTGLVGPLVVAPSRQFGEALFLQDRGDRRRAERLAVAGQGTADVVDGEVLLPQRDDLFPQPLLLAGRPALPRGRDEEVAPGLIAELMDEDPKAPRCVAEASGRLGRGETVDEEGPQGFVLPMGGVGGLQEPAGQC